MTEARHDWSCRWCRGRAATVVLDLGVQPTASSLPWAGDPLPDPVAPLRMVRCDGCGLLQLEEGLVAAEELMGIEPVEMVEQGRRAVNDLMAAGWAMPGETFVSFDSPHGNGWDEHLLAAGLVPAPDGSADLVVDIFGLMHDADQDAAFAERLRRVGPGGRLVLQVHPFGVDVASRAWNALRHGHYAYYSVEWLVGALAERQLSVVAGWQYPLQGGTAVLVARSGSTATDHAVDDLLGWERRAAPVTDAGLLAVASGVDASAEALGEYVRSCNRQGLRVAGYAAGSGVPPLLTMAGITSAELLAVGDASAEKQGRVMPVSRVPVVSPDELEALVPDRVLVFVPGLLDELRRAMQGLEARGGRFVTVDPTPTEVV